MVWIYVVDIIFSLTLLYVANIKIPIAGSHNKFKRRGLGEQEPLQGKLPHPK
jgi:hypothetical protein